MTNKININGKSFTEDELLSLISESKQPKQLFYPNGAVVKELEFNQDYWHCFIGEKQPNCTTWVGSRSNYDDLAEQQIFLTKEACEKYLDIDTTHNRLLKKIIEINAENGWEEQWKEGNDKYSLYFDTDNDTKDFDWSGSQQGGHIYMSEEAKDYMMSDEVSIDDFKKFLKIYN